jgi:hypothetical protein
LTYGKSHIQKNTIGEKFMKPTAISIIRIVCGYDVANKLELFLLLDNTNKQRIDLMSKKNDSLAEKFTGNL